MPEQFADGGGGWLILAAVAAIFFMLGRASKGGAPEKEAERGMQERQEADRVFASLPPDVQQRADESIQAGDGARAARLIADNSAAGAGDARRIVDIRRRAMGAV